MGLSGEKLFEYVQNKEKEIREREKEAMEREREERAKAREHETLLAEREREGRMRAREHEMLMAEKNIELEQAKGAAPSANNSSRSSSPILSSEPALSSVKARAPRLPAFDENKDEIDAYLRRFERFAENAGWKRDGDKPKCTFDWQSLGGLLQINECGGI